MNPQSVDFFLNNLLEIIFSIVVFVFLTNLILDFFIGYNLYDLWNWVSGLFSSKQKEKHKKRQEEKKKEKEMKDYGL